MAGLPIVDQEGFVCLPETMWIRIPDGSRLETHLIVACDFCWTRFDRYVRAAPYAEGDFFSIRDFDVELSCCYSDCHHSNTHKEQSHEFQKISVPWFVVETPEPDMLKMTRRALTRAYLSDRSLRYEGEMGIPFFTIQHLNPLDYYDDADLPVPGSTSNIPYVPDSNLLSCARCYLNLVKLDPRWKDRFVVRGGVSVLFKTWFDVNWPSIQKKVESVSEGQSNGLVKFPRSLPDADFVVPRFTFFPGRGKQHPETANRGLIPKGDGVFKVAGHSIGFEKIYNGFRIECSPDLSVELDSRLTPTRTSSRFSASFHLTCSICGRLDDYSCDLVPDSPIFSGRFPLKQLRFKFAPGHTSNAKEESENVVPKEREWYLHPGGSSLETECVDLLCKCCYVWNLARGEARSLRVDVYLSSARCWFLKYANYCLITSGQ